MSRKIALWAIAALLAVIAIAFQYPVKADNTINNLSRAAGEYYAPAYFWRGSVVLGNSATGSQTITLGPSIVSLPDGRQFHPFGPNDSFLTPVTFDFGTNNETVTPTAVSPASCPTTGQFSSIAQCISFTGTFSFAHGTNSVVVTGTAGAQEAALDAFGNGGGAVLVDGAWSAAGGTTAILNALIPIPSVSVIDKRQGQVQYWNVAQSTATVIAAPTTLTATTVGFALNGANATGGTYTGASTYHVAIACVDVMGNESQPSADFSGLTAGSGTTNQIGFAAPAAQTGCVGYVPYISLAGGSYALAYRVPVATYTNGVAAANGVCALTPIETITAACKITNATYGQTGVAAIVSALTVNTARIWVGLGGTSTTADLVGNSTARQSYAYVPGSRVGIPGMLASHLTFSTPTAAATTVPSVLATIAVPPAYMNFVSRGLRVCFKASQATGGTATVTTFNLVWDADGSNTTGAGVTLGSGVTGTITQTASAASYSGCEEIRTTVSGAGATAGSIKDSIGWYTLAGGVTSTSNQSGTDTSVGATGSLNVAQEARIDLMYTHTTGTDGAGLIIQDLTVEPLT